MSGELGSMRLLEEKAKKYIPADVRLLAGCRDEQTSADLKDATQYYNHGNKKKSSSSAFSFSSWLGGGSKKSSSNQENPLDGSEKNAGGGAFTACLLKVLWDISMRGTKNSGQTTTTYQELLFGLRDQLKRKGFTQIPQLSSSRCLNLSQPFSIYGTDENNGGDGGGTKRALMIGINYKGMPCELSGCHNDVNSVSKTIYMQIHTSISKWTTYSVHMLPFSLYFSFISYLSFLPIVCTNNIRTNIQP